jgi:dienelactone hydrolase
MLHALRSEIGAFVRLPPPERVGPPSVHEELREDGYTRKRVSYPSGSETIEAFLFEPHAARPGPGVVALHQHNSEWAIGKSEIAGSRGDPLQAFGPALARSGVTVLAPDAVGFESRCRRPGHGTALAPSITRPGGSAEGWLQYYNHAMHRLVRGELLITQVLADVAAAVGVLGGVTGRAEVGVLGHSYGGIVALFAAALDTRIAFACSSGAACSYRHKLAHGTGLDMSLVIPGFATRFDVEDLLRCVAPRKIFIVSSEDDPYAADAEDLLARARPAFEEARCPSHLRHLRVSGAHALDPTRFHAMVEYAVAESAA